MKVVIAIVKFLTDLCAFTHPPNQSSSPDNGDDTDNGNAGATSAE